MSYRIGKGVDITMLFYHSQCRNDETMWTCFVLGGLIVMLRHLSAAATYMATKYWGVKRVVLVGLSTLYRQSKVAQAWVIPPNTLAIYHQIQEQNA